MGGFTLLEMLVAISVFSVVAVAAVGLVVMLIRVQGRVHIFQQLQDNMRFSMDFMNRSMLGGRDYRCISPTVNNPSPSTPLPPNGLVNDACNNQALLYLHPTGKHVAYRLRAGVIEVWTEGTSGYVRMTDPRVTITNLRFYVSGAAANNNRQPRVTVILQASVPDPRGGAPIMLDLETTTSQRILDS